MNQSFDGFPVISPQPQMASDLMLLQKYQEFYKNVAEFQGFGTPEELRLRHYYVVTVNRYLARYTGAPPYVLDDDEFLDAQVKRLDLTTGRCSKCLDCKAL